MEEARPGFLGPALGTGSMVVLFGEADGPGADDDDDGDDDGV